MRQSPGSVLPRSREVAIPRAGIGVLAPAHSGVSPIGRGVPGSYGADMGISVSVHDRVSGWRARNWRRVLVIWFAASMASAVIVADVPSASVRDVLGVVVAGVPVLLAALP
jgi:hypothetical protein